jgi:primase-polymerase (primpol)-like protein
MNPYLLDLFLAGLALVLLAIVLWQSHRLRRAAERAAQESAQRKPLRITQPTAEELENRLREAYSAEIEKSTKTFGTDLAATSTRLSEQVSRLTTTVIEEELQAYQKTLQEVREVAIQAMDQIHTTVEKQRVELRHGMESELAAEKMRLVDKFDAKFGDVVSSYISESLGSGVDLGAQMQFILTNLEEHKADIRKDLLNGV